MKIVSIISVLVSLMIMAGCTGNQAGNSGTTTLPITNSLIVPSQATTNTSTGSHQKEFTLDELKEYNGQNGNAAYVAVDGVVYDVTNSNKWRNGLHSECSNSTYAGTDFTELINSSPHGTSVLSKLPVVGTLKK